MSVYRRWTSRRSCFPSDSTLRSCSGLYRVRWYRSHWESSFIGGGNRSVRRKLPSTVGEDENTTAISGDRTGCYEIKPGKIKSSFVLKYKKERKLLLLIAHELVPTAKICARSKPHIGPSSGRFRVNSTTPM